MNTWKIGLWFGVMGIQPWAVVALPAAPTSTQVYFSTNGDIEHANAALEIPANAQDVFFDIGDPDDSLSKNGSRVRYRLEGIDSDWRQKIDEMSFTVFFYNATGDQVGQRIYNVTGKSSGWGGSIEQSKFTHRHEDITVPKGAAYLSVVMSSAGPPTTVGLYIIKDIVVVQEGAGDHAPQTILDSRPFLQGSSATTSEWIRTGRRPSMASLIPAPGVTPPTRAFCILDDDGTSYAEWGSPWKDSGRLTPGHHLSVDWNEIYETGMFKWNRVRYPLPPSGHYRFAVQEVDILDHPRVPVTSLEITILPPYWRNPWFWGKCTGGVALLILIGTLYWRHTRNRLKLQQARLMEQERMRIARDLHDDLGARLTHISLMSAFAGSNVPPAGAPAKFQEISTMTRDLVTSLSEVVWAVNPENDRLESMVHYLCHLIQRLCQPSSLKCRVDELTGETEYAVSSQLRHHVMLAVKEAVNNALKHSEATELHARIRFQAPILTISIADNGKGLPETPRTDGNGMKNMRERIALVNGRIKIESTPGKGTLVLFEIPIC
ncbi:MAG TPA: sensor histidine kinase [Rariglobus sp.]|jgi:signal transduction histidine kinase|nr:sensor histidine kinase [Rariglobus sp.]